jgi:hypothetical protein
MFEENDQTQFRREGDNEPFEMEEEKENSTDPSPVKPEVEKTQSPEGEKSTQDDKDVPFHQHPRWLERENEWKNRYNESEKRHQDDLMKIRAEFSAAKKENSDPNIPEWFGGNAAQWEAYQKDQTTLLSQAEERALKRITEEKETKDKAIKEATDFMQEEMTAISNSKEINPAGLKVESDKLLKFVVDNDLVDSKGRWNYRAAFRLMNANAPIPKPPADRKVIAAATTSNDKSETKPAQFKTNLDFKKNRPW